MANGRRTGFINPQQYLEANLGAGQRLAGEVAGDIEGQGAQYGKDLSALEGQFQEGLRKDKPVMSLGAMPGYEDLARRAAQLSMRAGQAGTSGGTGQLMTQRYGMTTPGGSAYDAFYARAAPGGDRLGGLAAQYGDLGKALGLKSEASEGMAQAVVAKQQGMPAKLPTKGGTPEPQPQALPTETESAMSRAAFQRQNAQDTTGLDKWWTYDADISRSRGMGPTTRPSLDTWRTLSADERSLLLTMPRAEADRWIQARIQSRANPEAAQRARLAGF